MPQEELIWRIAGGSGDGINLTSQAFAKTLMRAGFHVFTHRHFPSRIRGGHMYTEIRAADRPVTSRGDGFNFLLALGDSYARNIQEGAYYGNEEIKPLTENLAELREGGIIVYDTGLIDIDDIPEFDDRVEANDWHVYPLDFRSIAREHGREIMRNVGGIAATCALIDLDLAIFKEIVRERYEQKGEETVERNHAIIDVARSRIVDEFEAGSHDIALPENNHEEDQALVSGSHAIAFGAIDEGCRFISGYPMTPWTAVFTIMSTMLPDLGGIAEQVEDEIAAACMAIGASHAGVKAMSGSSGGGFSLMSEALGLAEMVEEPVVLLEAMRAGPATGMPTKSEQGDLEHVLYTSQGDSSRVVLAPGDIEEAYEQTRLAFQLAYEFNVPVVLVYDQKLAGEYRNVPVGFFDRVPNPSQPGTLSEAEIADIRTDASDKFQRYRYESEKGVARRTIPGQQGGRYLATGNEHNPAGHISEDPENRLRQVNRRLDRIRAIRDTLDDGTGYTTNTAYGPDDADVGIITWGSQQGTVAEAVDRLNEKGEPVRALSVSELAPFPTDELESFLSSVDEALVVEMNATGQFHRLVQAELGRYGPKLSSLLKYDGNPFEPREIVEAYYDGIGTDSSNDGVRTRVNQA